MSNDPPSSCIWQISAAPDGDRSSASGSARSNLGRGVDFEDLGFTLVELRIAALQIVAHLVRLDCLTVQNAVDRARRELGQAGMPRQRAVAAGVDCQQAQCPQFVRIAAIFGLGASLANQPGP